MLLRALRREPLPHPPVWLMRQAGRYLPEYRAVRARSDFLTMVRTPELAVEVTLQPVARYAVNAAIIFSDILVVPQARWMHLDVEEGSGPRFPTPLRTEADIHRLHRPEPRADLAYMLDALRLTWRALRPETALLGYAGAPWILAVYMVEGHGGKGFQRAKRMLADAPALAHDLLGRLADAVSIDWQTAPITARRRLAGRPVALRGDFDPTWLYAAPVEIRRRVAMMLEGFAGPGYIANLGHGVLPDIPVEHVGAFIEAVRK